MEQTGSFNLDPPNAGGPGSHDFSHVAGDDKLTGNAQRHGSKPCPFCVPSLRDSDSFFQPTQGSRPGLIYAAPTALVHRGSSASSASRQCSFIRDQQQEIPRSPPQQTKNGFAGDPGALGISAIFAGFPA
jgi:hypothetical protein